MPATDETVETRIEELCILLVRAKANTLVPVTPPLLFPLVHFNEDATGLKDRLYFKAEKREEREDGPRGAVYDLEVDLRLTIKDPATADLYFRTVEKALKHDATPAPAYATDNFVWFQFLSAGGENDRENVEHLRKWSRKFVIRAKES